MAFDLRLTDAGRAALADGANAGAAAVRITHVAIGDGSGPGGAADDARTELRNERAREAATGTEAVARRIGVRADFELAADAVGYSVTEAGLIGAAPGADPALLAYWSDSGAELGKIAPGTTFVAAATLEFVASAADVTVELSPSVSLGGTALPATTERPGAVQLATAAEAKSGESAAKAVTPAAMRAAAGANAAALASDGVEAGSRYVLQGNAMGELVAVAEVADAGLSQDVAGAQADIVELRAAISGVPAQVNALTASVGALQGKTQAATTDRAGIAELATEAEAKAGANASRIVTPAGMRAATAANIASLLPDGANLEADKKYVLKGLADGGLALVAGLLVLVACRGMSGFSADARDGTVNYRAGQYAGLEPYATSLAPRDHNGYRLASLHYLLPPGVYLFFGFGRQRPLASGLNPGPAAVEDVALDLEQGSVFPMGSAIQKLTAAAGADRVRIRWETRRSREISGNFVIAGWPWG